MWILPPWLVPSNSTVKDGAACVGGRKAIPLCPATVIAERIIMTQTLRTPPHEPPQPSVICEQLTVWQMVLVAVAIIFVGTIALIFWPNPGGY